MKTKTRPYDAAEYLKTEADVATYLQAALEEGDAALVVHALGNIAAPAACHKSPAKRGCGAKAFTRPFLPTEIQSSQRS